MSIVQSWAPDMPSGLGANIGAVLADAAALHGGRNHDGRESGRRAVVDGAENERLRAAAAGARHADSLRIDIRQARQKIQSSDAVPGLQPHEALQSQLGF